MIETEIKEIQQPTIQKETIVSVICDRCGKDALCTNASARITEFYGTKGPWGVVEVLIQGAHEKFYADLCRMCSEDLTDWIRFGK